MSFNYAVCEVDYYFNTELDQSMCTVNKPLQLFANEAEAEAAANIMSPFYDYDIRVVRVDSLHEHFR